MITRLRIHLAIKLMTSAFKVVNLVVTKFLSRPLRQIPAQKKNPFVLVLVSEHSQISEINAAVIRKLWVKSSKSNRRISSSAILKTCLVSYSHGFIPELICACVFHFPCVYAASVNIRYAYVYACADAYVAL